MRKLSNLEIYVTQCTQAIQSIPQCSKTSSISIEGRPSPESDGTGHSDTHLADQKNDCKELARSYKRVSSSLARQRKTLARLKLPSWLRSTSLCLELCGQRSLYGMSLDVRVYRIVSDTAPIMEFARAGNVPAIQEMFSKGAASPHDTTIYGSPLLEVGPTFSTNEKNPM